MMYLLVKAVLFDTEVDLFDQVAVDLLLELLLELLRRFQTVLGRTEDTTRPTLFVFGQFDHFALFQYALNQTARRRQRWLLLRESSQRPADTLLLRRSVGGITENSRKHTN